MAGMCCQGFHQAVRELHWNCWTRLAVTGNPFLQSWQSITWQSMMIPWKRRKNSLHGYPCIRSIPTCCLSSLYRTIFQFFNKFLAENSGSEISPKPPRQPVTGAIHAAMHLTGFLESIIGILQYPTREAFQSLLELYSRLAHGSNSSALIFCRNRVLQSGSQIAMDAICELFILYETMPHSPWLFR